MALWKKIWLLFTVIWLVVAGLNIATILAFAEGAERERAWWPLGWGLAVPVFLYFVILLWERWHRRRGKERSD